jgi:hypothetical protein
MHKIQKINTARFHGMRCLFGLITKDELHEELRKLDWDPEDDPALSKTRGRRRRRNRTAAGSQP